MDRPASVERLVVALRVEGESAEQLAVFGHDPDLSARDKDADGLVAVSGSDADVAQPAAIAQCDAARLVDAIVTDAILDGSGLSSRSRLDSGGEGLGRGAPIEGAVGACVVVVETEGIELSLEAGQRRRARLAGEEALEGLMQALDLAAGLRMVGSGVLGDE